MTDKRYWIWLQLCLGQGARFLPILEDYGSAEKLYAADINAWKMSPYLKAKQIEALTKYDITEADKIISLCDKKNYKIITFDDSSYPEKLREISNPPAVIYVDGELIDFDGNAVIGVVGTRKASTYGLKAAEIMSRGMAECGAVIVSGGALGVDSASHKGAMKANGKTVAVLGNGFGADYLRSNEGLRNKIKATGGALISEYPPETAATKFSFPMRNRIISALSDGLLVIEAGEKSGSLITATHASEQGRDVFAIPASLFDRNFQGTNKLIDDGAFVATSPESVLSHYTEKYKTLDLSKAKTPYELITSPANNANAQVKPQVTFDKIMQDRKERVRIQSETLSLDGEEKKVFDTLGESYTGIDDIIRNSGIPANRVLVALTMLEMKGVIESASGKRYRKK